MCVSKEMANFQVRGDKQLCVEYLNTHDVIIIIQPWCECYYMLHGLELEMYIHVYMCAVQCFNIIDLILLCLQWKKICMTAHMIKKNLYLCQFGMIGSLRLLACVWWLLNKRTLVIHQRAAIGVLEQFVVQSSMKWGFRPIHTVILIIKKKYRVVVLLDLYLILNIFSFTRILLRNPLLQQWSTAVRVDCGTISRFYKHKRLTASTSACPTEQNPSSPIPEASWAAVLKHPAVLKYIPQESVY